MALLGLLLLHCSGPLFAQKNDTIRLRGRITDQEGYPLADVTLRHLSSGRHVHTGPRGRFSIENVSPGDTLLISRLGYGYRQYVINKAQIQDGLTLALDERPIELRQVNVAPEINALSEVATVDLQTQPVNSSQEVLRKVPGLFIGQHAGGGKAEQIFLRGFDIDHGTDVNITVDGMPVNMVSHAHGQGYADLHFLIPETIEDIDFGKGPYYADRGNFTTAGYVDFRTKTRLRQSEVRVEGGSFNTLRTVALLDLLGEENEKQDAYFAGEYYLTDGPFVSSQHFNRFNLMGSYQAQIDDRQRIRLQASHFQSKWDASGQIPQRAVDAGQIGRFGAIDDTEGGYTQRTNLNLQHTRFIDERSFVRSQAYYSQYEFELFSNFTFFLEDPENGDQIRQFEDRSLMGASSTFHRRYGLGGSDVHFRAGVGLRHDRVDDNTLTRTRNRRQPLDTLALGDVSETNHYAFADAEFDFGHWLIQPGLRIDYFTFEYVNRLQPLYNTQADNGAVASPKLNIVYAPTPQWQLYLKNGLGFHSNDSRVVVERSARQTLPQAYGSDLGAIWKPTSRIWLNTALWYLYLEQEFVYVGDAGIVEPSGETQRTGIDLGLRYQLLDWLFLDGDVNYAFARSLEAESGADYIPLAPDWTSAGGLAVRHPSGITGGLRYRYIDDRPANEDNSIVAEGYTVVDANLGYQSGPWQVAVIVENLFDVNWNETQFATESRLRNEAQPVEEIHFTPGIPFFLKARVGLRF